MRSRYAGWLTAQQTAAELDTTSAEVCRLLSIGRLSGVKVENFRGSGKAQWLVNPKSIAQEKKRKAKLATMGRLHGSGGKRR